MSKPKKEISKKVATVDISGENSSDLGLANCLFLAFIVAVLVLSVLLLGGMLTRVVCGIEFAFSIVLLLSLGEAFYKKQRHPIGVALKEYWGSAVLFLAFVVFVFLQIIPLPPEIIQQLSPRAYDRYQQAAASSFFISVDPWSSADGLIWVVTCFFIFFWILGLPRQDRAFHALWPRQRRKVEEKTLLIRAVQTDAVVDLIGRTIVFVGALSSVVAIVHGSLKMDSLYGLWPSESIWPYNKTRLHWPFVNPNHLAGFLLIALALSWERFLRFLQITLLSLGEDAYINSVLQIMRNPQRLAATILYGATTCLIGITILLTFSRAGIALLLLTVAIIYVATLRITTRAPISAAGEKRWRFVPQCLLLLGLVVIALLILSEEHESMLAARVAYGLASGYDEFRMLLAKTALAIFENYWVAGVGFGCWSLVSTHFATAKLSDLHLDYAHNDILQLMGEVGVIGSVIVLASALYLIVKLLRLWPNERVFTQRIEIIGLTTASIIPVLHGLVDFPLHITSINLIWFLCLACLLRTLKR